jgi:hypothetical protein
MLSPELLVCRKGAILASNLSPLRRIRRNFLFHHRQIRRIRNELSFVSLPLDRSKSLKLFDFFRYSNPLILLDSPSPMPWGKGLGDGGCRAKTPNSFDGFTSALRFCLLCLAEVLFSEVLKCSICSSSAYFLLQQQHHQDSKASFD